MTAPTSSHDDRTRAVLSARGLRRDFSGFVAVKDVDLDVHHGKVHALIGPNGAGKTTVFNLLTKFLQPTAGSITLDGHDITRAAPATPSSSQITPDREPVTNTSGKTSTKTIAARTP